MLLISYDVIQNRAGGTTLPAPQALYYYHQHYYSLPTLCCRTTNMPFWWFVFLFNGRSPRHSGGMATLSGSDCAQQKKKDQHFGTGAETQARRRPTPRRQENQVDGQRGRKKRSTSAPLLSNRSRMNGILQCRLGDVNPLLVWNNCNGARQTNKIVHSASIPEAADRHRQRADSPDNDSSKSSSSSSKHRTRCS